MRRAAFIAMAINLTRDRAAFALTFLLPPAIFCIFALVFASAAGGDLRISLAVAAGDDAMSRRLVRGLASAPEIVRIVETDEATVPTLVRRGEADAGLIIIRTPGKTAPDFRLYKDLTREAAAIAAEQALARQKPGAASDDDASTLERTPVNPANTNAPMAAYYAAGVTMLFLFLSGFQSALSTLEERDNGLAERLGARAGALPAIIDGKFAFILVQGLLQTVMILIAASLVFGVDLRAAPLLLTAAAIAASVCAAGVALCVTLLCRSRAQAHAVGVVLSLIMAALGGSMAPRFLMPPDMQAVGALTPNALGIDAFGAALWTGASLSEAAPRLALLLAIGGIGLLVARVRASRTLDAGV